MNFLLQDGYAVRATGFPEYPVSFRFGDQLPTLQETSAPGLGDVEVNDAGRSFAANTQNINLTFTEAVTVSTTGWSLTVNGVSKTLTYVSGTGSANVVFRTNIAIHDGDDIRISYDPSVGNTVSVTGSLAIKKLVGVEVTESLSRRIRDNLCDANDAVVANESVKMAVLEYSGDVVTPAYTQGAAPPAWMSSANIYTVTTGADGSFDIAYTGFVRGGGSVYLAVIRSNGQTLIVRKTVV